MSNHGRPRHHYGTVQKQMERVSKDQEHRLRQIWIDRVLNLLESDNLISLAATKPRTEQGMIFECNFAPKIWDDPRIERRVQQLATNEITVELIEYEHTVAGKAFQRTQIRVVF